MIGPGDIIRDIRIVERLGAGGMGEVYLGVQETIGREVAVKAIRADRRPGSRAKARFLREAHILAQLEHPNICRLYDYIETDEQDLIVLELIRGRSLSEILLSPVDETEKMRIAEQVLAALEAAHAISVIHRDLKPENIMVADDGTVKVLDFGLARHVVPATIESDVSGEHWIAQGDGARAGAAEQSALTHLGDIIGTPRYLSPEQARGEPLTAASDIFSFGLVLQELWTGRPPFGKDIGAKELVVKAMWGDIEPVEGIDSQVAELIHELTALAPRRRPSAAAVQDRLRWIRERPRRRARRRLLAAVILALTAAAAASTAGFFHARRSQQKAEAAQAEAEAVNEFLRAMLASPAPTAHGIDTKVVEVIDEAAERIESDLVDHPLIRATIHSTLGETYFALGGWSPAHEQFSNAAVILRAYLGPDDPRTISNDIDIGITLAKEGHYEEAVSTLEECFEHSRTVLGDDSETTIAAMASLSVALQRVGRFDDAEPLIRQELAWKRQNFGEEDERTLRARINFANLLARSGQRAKAESEYRDIFLITKRVVGEDHPDTLSAEHNLATELTRVESRAEEALPLFEDIIERRRRVLGEEHPNTLLSMSMEAVLLRRLGRYEAAERRTRETLEIRRRTLGEHHPDTIDSQMGLAIVLTKQGRFDAAETLYRQALEVSEATLGPEHSYTLNIVGNLGNLLASVNRYEEAESAHRRLYEGISGIYGPDNPKTWAAANSLSGTLIAQGKFEEAESLVVDVLARSKNELGLEHTRTLNAMGNHALILQRQGRLDEAEALLRTIIEVSERNSGPNHPRVTRARSDLAGLLEETGRSAEAEAIRAGSED